MANPYIQNRRVKQISSLPVNFTKDKVGEMLTAPYDSEQPLRQVSHILEYTAYPLFHIRKTYQNLLTYHSYVMPRMVSGEDTKKDDFLREWKLTEKAPGGIQAKGKRAPDRRAGWGRRQGFLLPALQRGQEPQQGKLRIHAAAAQRLDEDHGI